MPRRRFEDDDDDDDYDDRPRRRNVRRDDRPETNGYATAAFVLGLLSFCGSLFTGIPAIICGVVGLTKTGPHGLGRGMAIMGMVLGVLGTGFTVGVGIYFTRKVAKEVADMQQQFGEGGDRMNLQQLGMAAHDVHDATGRLPAGYTVSPQGKPLLSWRVEILPFIEEDPIYRQFDRTAAWDSPRNAPLANRVIDEFTDAFDPKTPYRAFVGPETAMPAGTGVKFTEMADGTANTILFVEAADAVPWPAPHELAYAKVGALPAFGKPGSATFLATMADGSVRAVKKNVDPGTLRKLIERADGNVIPPGWDR